MKKENKNTTYGRRTFLNNATKLAGASLILPASALDFPKNIRSVSQGYTVKQIINTVLKEIPGAPFSKTVDQLRSGSLEQEVSGIVTTMFPSLEVIEKTAKEGANLIVAHETPFYNNEDETDWLKQDDAYLYKIALLRKHNIAIWRFHDYWHAHKPDGILTGNLIKLGWEKYYNPDNPRIITLPKPMPLQSIAALTKEKLGIDSVRIVGNLKQTCSTIFLAFGYMDSKRQIAAIQELNPDLILSGETREWETVERVRDGLLMGKKTSLIVLSHAVSEEAGMEYAARWLQPKFPSLKVTHIPTGSPFQFL